MCGIVGRVSKENFSIRDNLLKPLKKLEYRGYDSVGYATLEGVMKKTTGQISELIDTVPKSEISKCAIAHTRWATHGGVTETNSHPHFNSDKSIFAVHNGIIENFKELKSVLEDEGYVFNTQTDSELIPHYFDYQLNKKKVDIKTAFKSFMNDVEGTFAVILLLPQEKGEQGEMLYVAKRNSPLALGICDGFNMLGSDIYAFSDSTDKAIFFDDNEFAEISANTYSFFDAQGNPVEKEPIQFTWSKEEESTEEFDHYMIKEVHEQPATSRRLLESLSILQKEKLEAVVDEIKKHKRVVFVAAGTSYHASLVGVYLLSKLGIEAHTVIASEFENFLLVDKDTVVIAISQSGETMDVVTVLKDIKAKGAKLVSVVNVPYSTIQRLSDLSLEMMAGQEICVAATKTFTNQVILMLAIAEKLGFTIDLDAIPEKISKTISMSEDPVKKMAEELKDKKDIFVLGRGMSYPIAREIALKLKEISYIHAEGMMGGELKHGTIALIEKGTPVISLIYNGSKDILSNTKEVEARGARTIIISDEEGDILVPECEDAEFAIYACIIGHLLSYYIAKINNLPIDKPRNLAKSVTVK